MKIQFSPPDITESEIKEVIKTSDWRRLLKQGRQI